MNLRGPEDQHSLLRARLRAGDPLETGAEEAALARIESRLDAEGAARPARGPRAAGLGWRLAVPAFALLTLVAVAWLGVRFAGVPRASRPVHEAGTDAGISIDHPTPSSQATPHASSETRQIQFETPGGTRVVWVLDSRFTL